MNWPVILLCVLGIIAFSVVAFMAYVGFQAICVVAFILAAILGIEPPVEKPRKTKGLAKPQPPADRGRGDA
jgi:hypothetical protein